jgi:DNA-directed RNA polymerase specialized sigma24 family protein
MWVTQLRTRPGMARFGDLEDEGGESYAVAVPNKPLSGSILLSSDLRDLPAHLQNAVRFLYVDGYSTQDAELLLGVAAPTVGDWLRKAADMLAEDGAARPERR